MNEVAADAIGPILSGGGVLAFAFIVYRAIEKLTARIDAGFESLKTELREDRKVTADLLTKTIERLARIDTRTYRMGLAAGATTPVSGVPLRHRTKPATPFLGEEARGNEEDGDG